VTTIELHDGTKVKANYVRHLRTLTHGQYRGNTEIDLFRTEDGRDIVCESPSNDARIVPTERLDLTETSAMFIER